MGVLWRRRLSLLPPGPGDLIGFFGCNNSLDIPDNSSVYAAIGTLETIGNGTIANTTQYPVFYSPVEVSIGGSSAGGDLYLDTVWTIGKGPLIMLFVSTTSSMSMQPIPSLWISATTGWT